MRGILSATSFLATASAVLAQTAGFDAIAFPSRGEVIPAGSTYAVRWEYTPSYAGTVSIQLLQGRDPATLVPGPLLASGLDNEAGYYIWPVPFALGADATYGLKMTYDQNPSVFQYSFPFHISKREAGAPAAPETTAPAGVVPSSANSPVQPIVYATRVVTVTDCSAPPAAAIQAQRTLVPSFAAHNATVPAGVAGVAAGTGAGGKPAPTSPAGSGSIPVVTSGAGHVVAGSVALVVVLLGAVFVL